jgi:anthranilate/para-aminobenzoate synthase component I
VRPRWQRYGATAIVTPGGVSVVGDDADCVRELCARLEHPAAAQPVSVHLSEPLELGSAHRRRIRRALELIAAGDLYQVNLARRFVADVRGRAVDVLAALQVGAAAPHAAALTLGDASVISVSPELLLSLDARGALRTAPIKGTRPRAVHPASDAALSRELDRDPKERAELTMVIDVERNDLGRIARAGSVRVLEPPHVRSLSHVHHRVAVLGAELRPGVNRTELFCAMVPSGSVTGAPKVRAMEVIAELEPERRGLYTGGFGSIGHDGSVTLGMAIRTLVVHDGRGVWFSGGGIVADSRPDREVEETLWKARPFLALAGIPLAVDTNSVPGSFAVR